jgi:hypothetical protein
LFDAEQDVNAADTDTDAAELQTNPMAAFNRNQAPIETVVQNENANTNTNADADENTEDMTKKADFRYSPLAHRNREPVHVNVRRASRVLQGKLADRPTRTYLIEHNILLAENQQFNEKVQQLKEYVRRLPNIATLRQQTLLLKIEDIHNDYLYMYSQMTERLAQYQQSLEQYNQDVNSREQQLRNDLNVKQIHSRKLFKLIQELPQKEKEREAAKQTQQTKPLINMNGLMVCLLDLAYRLYLLLIYKFQLHKYNTCDMYMKHTVNAYIYTVMYMLLLEMHYYKHETTNT